MLNLKPYPQKCFPASASSIRDVIALMSLKGASTIWDHPESMICFSTIDTRSPAALYFLCACLPRVWAKAGKGGERRNNVGLLLCNLLQCLKTVWEYLRERLCLSRPHCGWGKTAMVCSTCLFDACSARGTQFVLVLSWAPPAFQQFVQSCYLVLLLLWAQWFFPYQCICCSNCKHTVI